MRYQHFTEMPVWQKAHELVTLVYRLSSAFPSAEIYGLTSQMRRAGVSVSSNIAEAFGRHHRKDKVNFYYNARGSLYEVENQALIARDFGYFDDAAHAELKSLLNDVAHELNKIIKTLNTRPDP